MAGRVHPVLVVGDPVLHRPTQLVTRFDDSLTQLIDDMFTTMYAADGVGLAATQIGVGLAVFVYDCPDADGLQHRGHLINPRVVWTDDGTDDEEEACLSVPGPYAPLARPRAATVKGLDSTGGPVELHGTGFFARCLLHETDHLQGTLYIDHLTRRRRSRVLANLEPFEWNAPLYQG